MNKAGWQTKTLGEVLDIRNGKNQRGVESDVGEYPIYGSAGNVMGYATSYICEAGTTIIGRKGNINTPIYSEANFWNVDTAFGLAAKSELNSRFLYYFCLSYDFSNHNRGTTIPSLVKSDLLQIKIQFPPLPEQQRIVGILDKAFEEIAKAKANAEKNLQNARALFESHLQSVFTHKGKGWSEMKLGDTSILKIIDGDRGSNYPNKEDFSDDGFCLFLNTKNVRPDGFNFDTTMFVTEAKDKALRKGKLQRQDVILTTRGTIGNVAIYDEGVEFENIRINSGMLIFRPNTEKILPSFLFEVFRSGIMKSQMTLHVSGAAQPQLPIKTLIDFEIPVPNTLESQRKIVSSVREIDVETRRLESLYQRKLAALDELKKSLLHQAFTGQLIKDN